VPLVRDGSKASKAAEAVRPCISATPPKADVNSPPWLPPLSATTGREQVQQFTVIFQLLDHLFGDDEQRWRDDEAECLGSCQV
jgi:hypothetical protein